MSLGQDGPRPTRTRLPEGEGHTGGTHRAQPRRALFTVVGIVVLLVAALAFANRGDHPSSARGDGGSPAAGSGSGTDSRSGSGSGKHSAAPTDPTGVAPVAGKGAAGIPSGFAHSDQGAQSAAANYAVALGSADMFDATRRHGIVSALYDPAVSAGLQKQLDAAYAGDALKSLGLNPDGTAPAGLTFVSRTVPIGTKVLPAGATADAKTVEVWCTDLIGLAGTGSTKPVSTAWFTITEQLVWSHGDWKIHSSSQKDGPAPVAADTRAASATSIAAAIRDYGGFTYAR